MSSWAKSDSEGEHIGEADLKLAYKLAIQGSVHAKYRRMITVCVDITAPLYWWKEFDTYKVGTVANSCSTMHTLHKRDLTMDDFSCEFIDQYKQDYADHNIYDAFNDIIYCINVLRRRYVYGDYPPSYRELLWNQMIQLLPSSFNQKRTVMMNYEVLSNVMGWRWNHRLSEWREFCDWIRSLPYTEELIPARMDVCVKEGSDD